MPNAIFEPIIGSSFDNLAQQRAGWAGFNSNVENANLQRAAQAEAQHNAWLAHVAGMQQAEQARQDAYDTSQANAAAAQENLLRNEAEKRRQFDIGSEITKQADQEKSKWLKWHYDVLDKDKQKGLDRISNYATTKADDFAAAGAKMQDLQGQFASAQNDYLTAQAKEAANLPSGPNKKYVFNNRTGQYVPASSWVQESPDEAAVRQAVNDRIAEKRANYAAAQDALKSHAADLKDMHREANSMGLTVNTKDYSLFSPDMNQSWRGKLPTPQTPSTGPSAEAPNGWMPTAGGAWQRPITLAPSTSGTGTNPMAAASAATGAVTPLPPLPDVPGAATPPDDQEYPGAGPMAAPAPGAPLQVGRFTVTAAAPAAAPAPASGPTTVLNRWGQPVTVPGPYQGPPPSGVAPYMQNPLNRVTGLNSAPASPLTAASQRQAARTKVQAMNLDQLYSLKNQYAPDAHYSNRDELENIIVDALSHTDVLGR